MYLVQTASKQVKHCDTWAQAFGILRRSMYLTDSEAQAKAIFDDRGAYNGVYGFAYGFIHPA